MHNHSSCGFTLLCDITWQCLETFLVQELSYLMLSPTILWVTVFYFYLLQNLHFCLSLLLLYFSYWLTIHCRNDKGPSVLIIKDKEGYIYGGYASQPWERHAEFYGDMKSFIFQLYPKASIFRPTGANHNIQWVSLVIFHILAQVEMKLQYMHLWCWKPWKK